MATKRNVKVQIYIDSDGVPHKSQQSYEYTNDETFGMIRFTSGTGHLHKYTGNELLLMIEMLQIQDKNTDLISMTPSYRRILCGKCKISYRYLLRLISSIELKGGLKRCGRNEIALNPTHFHKGSTNHVLDKIEWYAKLKINNDDEERGIELKGT